VWSSGLRFPLGTVRTRVFYDVYSLMSKDPDPPAVATFNKLLLACMTRLPNSLQVRDRELGPVRCWEMDQSFCPQDLRSTWSAEAEARQAREREAQRIKAEEECRQREERRVAQEAQRMAQEEAEEREAAVQQQRMEREMDGEYCTESDDDDDDDDGDDDEYPWKSRSGGWR
jgi:hypothetical protein